MNISSHSWIIGTIISLFVMCLCGLFGNYFARYKYSYMGDIKHLSEHPDKYRVYLFILAILLPSMEFLLTIFHIKSQTLLIPNVLTGFSMLCLFFASPYFTIINKNLHKILFIFYIIYTIKACLEINFPQYNIISIVELVGILAFSSYIIYKIEYFLAYIISLFFFLIALHLFGSLTLHTLIICDSIIIMTFGINYGRYMMDKRISNNLIDAYNIVNKGNLLVVGVNEKGVVELVSENIQTILGCNQSIAIGKNWENELAAFTGFSIENQDSIDKESYLQKFSCKTGRYKLIEWSDYQINDKMTLKVGRDVTLKQRISAELSKTNQRLESLLSNSGDFIFVLDENYVCTDYYHHNVYDLYLLPKNFVGKKLNDMAIPDNAKGIILNVLNTASKSRKKATAEYSLPYQQGEEWFALSTSVIVNSENQTKEFVCIARNISESKKAEQKLIESNNRLLLLEELINNSKDSFCITREDGTLFYVNNIAAERFGINPNEAENYKVIDVEEKFEKKEEAWQAHLAEVKSHNRFVMEGMNINQKTKALQPAEITVSYSVVQEQGFITATIRDISERKKNEAEILKKNEALAASEYQLKQNLTQLQKAQEILEQQQAEIISIKDRFEVAINGSNDGIWDWDLRTNEVYFSPRWKSMLGYEDHEITNNYESFMLLIHPDYRALIKNKIQDYLDGGVTKYYVEFPMRCKKGQYCWILSRGAALRDANNKPYRMSGSHTDISEIRKIQSELKQLSLVAEKTTNGVVISDMEGKVIWTNQAYLEMMEISLEEIAGKRPRDVFEVHNNPDFLAQITQINGTNFNAQIELSTYLGQRIWVEIVNTIVKNEEGVPIQQVEIITNITERKLAETESQKRQRTLAIHNDILMQISTAPSEKRKELKDCLMNITKTAAEGLNVNRVSYWEFAEELIVCNHLYEKDKDEYSSGMNFKMTDYPNYVAEIKAGLNIIANNAEEQIELSDFWDSYIKPLGITSMIDVTIRSAGEIIGVLCIEHTEEARKWTSEECAFARAIADVITLAVEGDKRRRVEENLRESENNFRQINETIDDVFWLFDVVENKMSYISPSCSKILGVEASNFYEKNDFWKTYLFEKDKENVCNVHAQIRESGYYELEYRIHFKEEIRWIFEKAFAIRNEEGHIVKISGICSDITQERLTQDKIKELSMVAEKATNGIAIADKNGYISWANQAFLEMFEIPLEKLINQKPSVLFNVNGEAEVKEMQRLNSNNFTIEKEVKTYTQKIKWVELNHTTVKDANDNILQQIEILTDISERKKAEQELLEKQEQLQQLLDVTSNQNQRLQNFAHIVSHNIRSHSSNLSMLVSFLNEPENDAEQQKFFSMLNLSTNKLAETVENLNEIITIQNNLNVPKTLLSMKTEIEKTMQALNTIILANNVTVINEVSEEVCIKGLTSYIESILLNMLTNAIKYRAESRDCIVRFSAVKKGFFWVISIEDNGLGIDLARHGHKLFGMYKTFHKNVDARGIGLFITKNQIEAMGGKIEVESQVGIGSTFKIYFYAND